MESSLKRLLFLTIFTVLAGGLTSSFFSKSAVGDELGTNEKPNIIFILADDQGWNGTSVQMHPDMADSKSDFYRTPNLEKLAAAGLRFSHAYSPGPMCSPTRASLQTGKSPAQLRMTNVGRARPPQPSQRLALPPHSSTLSTDEVTIGETLQSAGYATAWFGKWHLGGDGPGAHGYDEHDGPTGNGDGNIDDPKNPKDVFGITERGIAFMEKNVKSRKPFYLQLWHYAVHGPVQSRPSTVDDYSTRDKGKTHDSNTFAGMTTDLDTGIGMILAKVKELGISENTYIVYMSDHGAGRNLSSNAPLNQGKGTLWEGGMRVPLIISGPGVASGKFCTTPTVGWDLFPTFCELAGVEEELPNGLEGVSLKPTFEAGIEKRADEEAGKSELAKRDAIAFHFPHYGNASPHSTITIGGFKLIKFYEQNDLKLFDLNQDIGEKTDLSKTMTKKTEMLARRLQEYLASIDAGLPTPNPNYDPAAEVAGGRGFGRPGRGGPGESAMADRQKRMAERQKELDSLEVAVTAKDFDAIGEIVGEMKSDLEASSANGDQANVPSRAAQARKQRETEVKQLEQAHQDRDLKLMSQLISKIKKRMANRPTGRPRGGRGGDPNGGSKGGDRSKAGGRSKGGG